MHRVFAVVLLTIPVFSEKLSNNSMSETFASAESCKICGKCSNFELSSPWTLETYGGANVKPPPASTTDFFMKAENQSFHCMTNSAPLPASEVQVTYFATGGSWIVFQWKMFDGEDFVGVKFLPITYDRWLNESFTISGDDDYSLYVLGFTPKGSSLRIDNLYITHIGVFYSANASNALKGTEVSEEHDNSRRKQNETKSEIIQTTEHLQFSLRNEQKNYSETGENDSMETEFIQTARDFKIQQETFEDPRNSSLFIKNEQKNVVNSKRSTSQADTSSETGEHASPKDTKLSNVSITTNSTEESGLFVESHNANDSENSEELNDSMETEFIRTTSDFKIKQETLTNSHGSSSSIENEQKNHVISKVSTPNADMSFRTEEHESPKDSKSSNVSTNTNSTEESGLFVESDSPIESKITEELNDSMEIEFIRTTSNFKIQQESFRDSSSSTISSKNDHQNLVNSKAAIADKSSETGKHDSPKDFKSSNISIRTNSTEESGLFVESHNTKDSKSPEELNNSMETEFIRTTSDFKIKQETLTNYRSSPTLIENEQKNYVNSKVSPPNTDTSSRTEEQDSPNDSMSSNVSTNTISIEESGLFAESDSPIESKITEELNDSMETEFIRTTSDFKIQQESFIDSSSFTISSKNYQQNLVNSKASNADTSSGIGRHDSPKYSKSSNISITTNSTEESGLFVESHNPIYSKIPEELNDSMETEFIRTTSDFKIKQETLTNSLSSPTSIENEQENYVNSKVSPPNADTSSRMEVQDSPKDSKSSNVSTNTISTVESGLFVESDSPIKSKITEELNDSMETEFIRTTSDFKIQQEYFRDSSSFTISSKNDQQNLVNSKASNADTSSGTGKPDSPKYSISSNFSITTNSTEESGLFVQSHIPIESKIPEELNDSMETEFIRVTSDFKIQQENLTNSHSASSSIENEKKNLLNSKLSTPNAGTSFGTEEHSSLKNWKSSNVSTNTNATEESRLFVESHNPIKLNIPEEINDSMETELIRTTSGFKIQQETLTDPSRSSFSSKNEQNNFVNPEVSTPNVDTSSGTEEYDSPKDSKSSNISSKTNSTEESGLFVKSNNPIASNILEEFNDSTETEFIRTTSDFKIQQETLTDSSSSSFSSKNEPIVISKASTRNVDTSSGTGERHSPKDSMSSNVSITTNSTEELVVESHNPIESKSPEELNDSMETEFIRTTSDFKIQQESSKDARSSSISFKNKQTNLVNLKASTINAGMGEHDSPKDSKLSNVSSRMNSTEKSGLVFESHNPIESKNPEELNDSIETEFIRTKSDFKIQQEIVTGPRNSLFSINTEQKNLINLKEYTPNADTSSRTGEHDLMKDSKSSISSKKNTTEESGLLMESHYPIRTKSSDELNDSVETEFIHTVSAFNIQQETLIDSRNSSFSLESDQKNIATSKSSSGTGDHNLPNDSKSSMVPSKAISGEESSLFVESHNPIESIIPEDFNDSLETEFISASEFIRVGRSIDEDSYEASGYDDITPDTRESDDHTWQTLAIVFMSISGVLFLVVFGGGVFWLGRYSMRRSMNNTPDLNAQRDVEIPRAGNSRSQTFPSAPSYFSSF